MKAMKVFLPVALACVDTAFCVDGFSVAMIDKGRNEFMDEVVQFTIRNNKVTDSKVLFKGECGDRSARPVISFDGTQIAFAGSRRGDDRSHIFVMNSDGGGLKPVVTPAYKGCSERHKFLDWPAGPFLYYRATKEEIRRVHTINPFRDESVANNPPLQDPKGKDMVMRKWRVSADAKRVAVQFKMCNVVMHYPRENRTECYGGCNAHVSAGGNYVCAFSDAGHVQIHISHWKPNSYTVEKAVARHNDDMSKWAGTDIGKGMDWPRWSANSDKWICLQVGRQCPTDKGLGGRFCGCGSNQVLFNWKDKQVIMTTNQPDGGAWVGAGDMWVQPPDGVTNAWETADGKWVAVNGDPSSGTTPGVTTRSLAGGNPVPLRIGISHNSLSVQIDASHYHRHRLMLLRMDGTCVARRNGTGRARYSFGKEIGCGICVVRADIGKTTYTGTVVAR